MGACAIECKTYILLGLKIWAAHFLSVKILFPLLSGTCFFDTNASFPTVWRWRKARQMRSKCTWRLEGFWACRSPTYFLRNVHPCRLYDHYDGDRTPHPLLHPAWPQCKASGLCNNSSKVLFCFVYFHPICLPASIGQIATPFFSHNNFGFKS